MHRVFNAQLRVLVIDDNIDAVDMLASLFSAMNIHVTSAYSGGAALEAAQTCHPNLVFVDLDMPDMSGFEVGKKLRAMPALESIGIFALTGRDDVGTRTEVLTTGFSGHLVKPAPMESFHRIFSDIAMNCRTPIHNI